MGMTIDASALVKMRTPVRGRCRKKPATLSAKDLGSALEASMALLQDEDRDALMRSGAPLAANAPPIAYAELVRDLTTLGLV